MDGNRNTDRGTTTESLEKRVLGVLTELLQINEELMIGYDGLGSHELGTAYSRCAAVMEMLRRERVRGKGKGKGKKG